MNVLRGKRLDAVKISVNVLYPQDLGRWEGLVGPAQMNHVSAPGSQVSVRPGSLGRGKGAWGVLLSLLSGETPLWRAVSLVSGLRTSRPPLVGPTLPSASGVHGSPLWGTES